MPSLALTWWPLFAELRRMLSVGLGSENGVDI